MYRTKLLKPAPRGRRRRRAITGAAVVAALASAGIAYSAQPDRIKVTTTDDVVDADDRVTSLREAFIEAADRPGVQRLQLARNSTYTLSCTPDDPEDEGVSGDLDHLASDKVIVVGRGSTITFEPGCEGHRLIDAGSLELRNVTLSGGGAEGDGGAVRVQGDLVARATRFLDNTAAGDGGAAYVTGSTSVRRSVFSGNTSGANGGALATGSADLVNTRFERNSAVGDGGAVTLREGSSRSLNSTFDANTTSAGRGGAVFAFPVDLFDVQRSEFDSNAALEHTAGGGALYIDGPLSVAQSVFTGNRATGRDVGGTLPVGGDGGAIYSRSAATIVASTFTDNHGGSWGHGGAIYAAGSLDVSTSEILGNTAGGWGGGIASVWSPTTRSGRLSLAEVTVDANAAGQNGGGIWAHHPGEVVLADTTISANRAHGEFGQGAGMHARGQVRIERSVVVDNVGGSRTTGGGLYFGQVTDAVLVETSVTGNVSGDHPAISGSGPDTTSVTVDAGLVQGNTTAVTGEIGNVTLIPA